MTQENWSIEQLVDKANALLPEELQVGVRNVRHLCSKGVLRAPVRTGRNAYYGQEHLDELVQVRTLMRQGFNVAGLEMLKKVSIEDPALYQQYSSGSVQESPNAASSISLMDIVSSSAMYEPTKVVGQDIEAEKRSALNFLDSLSGSAASAGHATRSLPFKALASSAMAPQKSAATFLQKSALAPAVDLGALVVEKSVTKTMKTAVGTVSLLQSEEQSAKWRTLTEEAKKAQLYEIIERLLNA